VRFAKSPAFLQKRIEELESLVHGVEEKAGIGAPKLSIGGGVQFNRVLNLQNPKPKTPMSVNYMIQSVFFLLRKHLNITRITRPKINLGGFLFFIYLSCKVFCFINIKLAGLEQEEQAKEEQEEVEPMAPQRYICVCMHVCMSMYAHMYVYLCTYVCERVGCTQS
jgi:hypothetical protein